MRRTKLWLAVASVLLAVNLLIGFRVYSTEAAKSGEDDAFGKVAVLMRVLHLIRQDYVGADQVNVSKLIDNAVRGMVSSLDPYSGFMDADEYREMMEGTEGEFGGLGIVVTVKDGLLTVVTPIEDSPGSRAGLRAGDQIVRIGGVATKDLGLHEAVKRLKGPPGSEIAITVARPSTGKTMDLTLKRAKIEVPSVKDTRVVGDRAGYVRITQFAEPTAAKLAEALDVLTKQGIQSLVIDLRNNPGGLLDSAVDACSLFLPGRTLVVYTQGRRPSQKRQYFTDKSDRVHDIPIVILVNRGSASAAEIMSGCLQDWGRALLVGEKTFGKGSVQNVIDLPDGSALRLTTARYYTPSERVIHDHGIEPNIAVPLSEEEDRALYEAQSGEVGQWPDPARDPQLRRALETLQSYDALMKGRKGRYKVLQEPAAAATDHGKPEADKAPVPVVPATKP